MLLRGPPEGLASCTKYRHLRSPAVHGGSVTLLEFRQYVSIFNPPVNFTLIFGVRTGNVTPEYPILDTAVSTSL